MTRDPQQPIHDTATPCAPERKPPRRWAYLKTPLWTFAVVMLPINALMLFLLVNRTPVWIRLSALAVILASLATGWRGYARRLLLNGEGAELRTPLRSLRIPWRETGRVGAYIPDGGVGSQEYYYVTRHDRAPAGKWEVDAATLQVQNRAGLAEAVDYYRGCSKSCK